MSVEKSETLSVHYKRISSKIIPGVLDSHNKGAIDWGWQDLLAYGCQSIVVVVDPSNVQILQTLDGHASNVTKVRWASGSYCQMQITPHVLKLASADSTGNIIIWNVKNGAVLSQLSDGNKQVLDIQWLNGNVMDGAVQMLAALHPPYSFVIWNTRTGTKLWKKTYTESLLSFTFDPFTPSNITFLCKDCLLLVDDFTLNKVPSSNGKKLYVSSPSANLGSSTLNLSGESSASDEKASSRSRDKIRRRVRLLAGVDFRSTKADDASSNNDALGFMYHPAAKHHLLLIYPREVLVLDLEINQTIGVITVEKNGSPFIQVIPFSQRDAICCLHENGMVSLNVRQNFNTSHELYSPGGEVITDIHYEIKAVSDPIRLTKSHRFYGITACPQTETKVSLLISDGRVLFLELIPRVQKLPEIISTLSDYIPPNYNLVKAEIPSGRIFRFLITAALQNASSPPFVIRMCPPLTTKNWNTYQPWMAAGTSSGVIQIFDMAAGMLHKELSVHTYPVRGVEWVSLSSIISYAHQNMSNSAGHVKNELYFTDILTGKMKGFRCDNQEESPIDMIRVSSLKQYFLIALKEDPLELWDIKSLSLLRVMSRQFPMITALEWWPTIGNPRKRMSVSSSSSFNMATTPSSLITSSISGSKDLASYASNSSLREIFIFVDTDGRLYQFIVDGNLVKDGRNLTPQNGFGSITTMSCKGYYLVMGDVDGSLIIMDLRSRTFKSILSNRGWIKKARFAPGKGNMKLLVMYNDGVDIWEILEGTLLSQIKCPKDVSRIEDCDWAASDKPIIATGDSCIRVMDINLKAATSSIEDRECLAPVWCPSLQSPFDVIRTFLLHSKSRANELPNDSEMSDQTLCDQLATVKNRLNEFTSVFDEIGVNNCALSVVHHYMTVARFLGDESEYKFWQVALHYLRLELANKLSDSPLILCDWCQTVFLDGNFDVICDTETYKKLQWTRLNLHESKQTSQELAQKRADTLILLQETDRAVQQLLETDPGTASFYSDCLRACIVASVQSSGLSQSTIKLVATNLIANGLLSEGVQLLCLINKGIDACRYLQSYGKWEKAMWLAKCTLNTNECLEVAKRWGDHLISPQVDQKDKAVHLMLSTRQFSKVLEMLFHFSYVERAAVFAELCEELQLITVDDFTKQLLKDVYLKYGRHLRSEGINGLAKYYATKADASNEFI